MLNPKLPQMMIQVPPHQSPPVVVAHRAENGAVGNRLIVMRKTVDGQDERLFVLFKMYGIGHAGTGQKTRVGGRTFGPRYKSVHYAP